ncbi:GntR family transcriptional regulator [Kitasatospora sp. NPDC004240]
MPTPAPYERAAAALREDILSGKFPPGEFLPGQRELAERYGVAYNTAGQALKLLATRGLVEVIPRRGSLVLTPAAALEIAWDTDGRVRPARAGESAAGELQVESLKAPDEVSRILQLAAGAQVLARRTVLTHSGAPWALRILYVPQWVVDEARVLATAELLDEARVLAERGLEETGHRSRWSARAAGVEEERLLRSGSSPVHVVERVSLSGDRPVMCEVTAVRSDRVFMSRTAGSGAVDPDQADS